MPANKKLLFCIFLSFFIINHSPVYADCPQGNKGNLDCDNQGLIGNDDLNILLEKWKPEAPFPTPNPNQWKADLNEDIKVNEIDLNILLGNWNSLLESCSPRDFKAAFILVARQENELTQHRIENINLIKNNFPAHFLTATKNLASIDTDYSLVTFVNDGNLVSEITYPETGDVVNILKAAQKFYENNNDEFHFLYIYTTFPTPRYQQHYEARNRILGIGLGLRNETASFGSRGNLLGVNHMGFIDNYNPQEAVPYNGLLHETGHQWCCYLGENFDPELFANQPLPIIQQGIHFYRGFSTFDPQGDPMDSDYWIPNGDGTFRRDDSLTFSDTHRFHPFVLYYMGLLAPQEITQTFPIYNAGSTPNFNFDSAPLAKQITIQNVIAVGGERSCAK